MWKYVSFKIAIIFMSTLAHAQLPVADMDNHTRKVQVGDLVFPVFDQGEGEVVLLLHGFPDSRHLWRFQVPVLLDAGFRVIAPDLKGFGEAPKPLEVEAYGLSVLIQEVLGIMDSLKIDSFYIVGHDWGALLTWIIAATQPQRIKKLVALSVGCPGTSGTRTFEQLKASWYGTLIAHSKGVETLFQADDWAFFKKLTQNNGDLERYISDLSRPGALTAALNYYKANFRPDFSNTSSLPAVKADAMGIWSDGDIYLTEKHVTSSPEKLEGKWRYEKITGASHWLMLDKPNEVNKLLLEFLGNGR